MKDLIIMNLGNNGSFIGDSLQEQLAQENQIQELNLLNKDLEFLVKPFYYETQNGQFVPKTIFIDPDQSIQKKKYYARQNFSSLSAMADKCENLQGIIVINSTGQDYTDILTQYQQDFPKIPFYFFTLIEDLISYQQQINLLKNYEILNNIAECSIAINGQTLLQNKQFTNYPTKNIGQFINFCLASVNQMYKRNLDVTRFSEELFDNYDQKYLSCGFDNQYLNSFTNNWNGINYKEGKFNKSALIIRGEQNQEQTNQVLEYTQSKLIFGILEKQQNGVAQISSHSKNVITLKETIEKYEKMPKQFFNIDFEINDSLKQIIASYEQ